MKLKSISSLRGTTKTKPKQSQRLLRSLRSLAMTALLFCVFSGFSFAEEELYLEGISYEPTKPTESMAVINGVLLKQGDQYQNYRVVEVKSNFVRLAKLDGSGERELHVTGGAPKPVETEAPIPTGTSAAGEAMSGAGQDMQKMMAEAMTRSVVALGQAKSASGLADLKQIYTAANVYFAEYGDSKSITFDQLIKNGMLSPAFQSGVKGDYRFTIKDIGEGVTVNADPVDKSSGLRHFFIDENGDVYSEENKTATSSSPRYKPQMPF